MTVIVPQFNTLSEATVRRLVADLMADLEIIPDHRDRRGRVYPLSSLLAIHLLASIGDGQGPEDAADFARDPTAWLRRLGILGDRIPSAQTLRRLLRDRDTDLLAELQPLVVRRVRRLEAACGPDADAEPETDADAEPLEACAVDGKTVRASFDAVRGIRRTHIVSARLDCGLVVHQTAVPEKRGEPGHPPTPGRSGSGGPCRLHRRPGLPDRHRTADRRGGRLVPAGRQGQPVRPACPPAARLRLPGPHRRRGPRPQRDRGTGARTH